jgi:mannose-6-phosphate isomerase
MLYPLTFEPIFKERIWGGRKLEELYGKKLPINVPVGESWEISDRPDDVSVISNGPLKGKTLNWLVTHYTEDLFGPSSRTSQRGVTAFPLLIKILDAQEKLSLQVHPPAKLAPLLGGEPKTEMWYIVHAEPGAELYVGLKRGVTRAEFERKIKDGTVADCFHRVPVKSGDAMFLPSGRVHAIGAGLVIFEVQQNSDTTYRVFDWNRVDKNGNARELHVKESLASIDFEDFEPALLPQSAKSLVEHELFRVRKVDLRKGESIALGNELEIVGVITGSTQIAHGSTEVKVSAGQFCLLPACCANAQLRTETDSAFLRIGM